MKLAFGYEIDLPEDVEIMEESWMPDNPPMMYLLAGTYQNGEEKFNLCVNYDSYGYPTVGDEFIDGVIFELGTSVKSIVITMCVDMTASTRKSQRFDSSISDMYSVLEQCFIASAKAAPETHALHFLPILVDQDAPAGKEPILVAGGRYTLAMVPSHGLFDLPYETKTVTEGNVIETGFTAIGEGGFEIEGYAKYQYYPLPDGFAKDVEQLWDLKYIEVIYAALDVLGEEKAELLRSLLAENLHFESPVAISNELLKQEDHREALQKAIQEIDPAQWPVNEQKEILVKKEEAISLCRYWEIFGDTKMPFAGTRPNEGIRWMDVPGDLIGGGRYPGEINACAVFDGALHCVTGQSDLAPIPVKDWKPEDENAVLAENNQSQAFKPAVTKTVNTKSSPLTPRETPEKNGAQVILIPKGETVKLLKDGDWPLVEYNGLRGYVNGVYLR